ncbi:PAS domain-containing protein [uncultured Marivita sp.]|uniref:PAS domain-containing protein n=1 Tax=uncultured Marivita sp. TaxID=888080 RepID=UPI002623E49E|nr:PAS domain-containing protein [uncultured Marivita sp.]
MTPEFLVEERLKQHGHRALQELDSYWHGLAVRGDLPKRAEVDPAAIQDALEFAFIADRVGRSHARFRVAGGAISGVVGTEVAGLPLSTLLHHGSRATLDAALARCFAGRLLLELTLGTRPDRTGQTATATLRLYPLLGARGEVGHLLGAFVATSGGGNHLSRFDVTDMRETPWTNCTVPARPRQTGHLRLVIDNT